MRSVTLGLLIVVNIVQQSAFAEPWRRHVVDNQYQGADGVRLGDFNGDGLSDVVTGWEESGLVRLYLNPGPKNVKRPWPSVTIAKAASPEDAVPMDVDGDGKLDIISCHEGKRRQVLVHFSNVANSNDNQAWLSPRSWSTSPIAALDGVMWMYALPLPLNDGRQAIVLGSKGPKASLTLLVPDRTSIETKRPNRDLDQWQVIRLRQVGWTMSLRSVDMDGDGDQDIVFTDRKGSRSAAAWLEQPKNPSEPWEEHLIAGQGREVMFMTASPERCLIATRRDGSIDCVRQDDGWTTTPIKHPPFVEFGKAIEVLPGGQILLSANTKASRHPDQPGLWIRDIAGNWDIVDPTPAVKFDRFELIDFDGDGDLDAMTCEERQNFGVVWYENPGL
ncbi:VCBS repeat-containing protein [Stieleria sp. JC731]|uniref:FG-GAP repeat domain-containing protein n=1 Tax=Pirellulaceae TaxID=2691357 RepID=UPI001E3C44EF|nr:VCBS repeat-containing protein [Stieleria sp. JC731]MCC9599759.1 VCBS repeat-containing protein [Stieleria sp. JC731]